MGVSGDGVQQFVDRFVDEDHRSLSTADAWKRSNPRSAMSLIAPPGPTGPELMHITHQKQLHIRRPIPVKDRREGVRSGHHRGFIHHDDVPARTANFSSPGPHRGHSQRPMPTSSG
jgi:hypothetical protein